MKNFIDYIETSCADLGSSQSAYRYKKKVLDEMTERANEITRTGLKDEKVLCDIITEEYPDLKSGYKRYIKEKRKSEFLRFGLPIGGLISLVVILIAYFTVSALTYAWDKTWLIIVGGVFAMIIFYFSVAIAEICKLRRVFHPIARLLIVICTVLIAVFVFLFSVMMIPEMTSWPILPGGVALALIADLAFAYITKQKLRTISLFVYMPAISTMIYIILASYSVISWLGGWPVILLGLVADFIYILFIIMNNAKYFMYKQEADE